MGQQQSKDELLYQQVNYGNIEGIKALCRDGAGLEWIDRDGKTPLILVSMNPQHFAVAKTLIELGANVNAYRPGRHAGTPLHHAAKRGLENTVKLLLSHGANALVMNDDCQSPLEVARAKGHINVVRAIENHICLFSGWMREFYGLGFLEVLAPQLLSRKVWVVIVPSGSRNPTKPFKLELAIYSNQQDAQPRIVVALWKAKIEDPKMNQPDLSVTIIENSSIPRGRRRRRSIYTSHARCRPRMVRQTRIKLAPENEGDRQQFQWFCNACRGIPQANPAFLNFQTPVVQGTAPPESEDLELAMAINASLQSAIHEMPPLDAPSNCEASASNSWKNAVNICSQNRPGTSSGIEWPKHESGSSAIAALQTQMESDLVPASQTSIHASESVPSAPPITDNVRDDGPIEYPSIDSSPVDMLSTVENLPASENKGGDSSTCVVCLDAPSEAACVPCGHVAGCISCLNEIKAKKWGCPVCRAKIDQVVKLYRV